MGFHRMETRSPSQQLASLDTVPRELFHLATTMTKSTTLATLISLFTTALNSVTLVPLSLLMIPFSSLALKNQRTQSNSTSIPKLTPTTIWTVCLDSLWPTVTTC